MQDVTVRLFIQKDSGRFESNYSDFNLSQFAGVIPCIGDQFLHPSLYFAGGQADLGTRFILTVVGRVFNLDDNSDHVGLMVTERPPTEWESNLYRRDK
jgi:hypothetical protein